MPVLSLKALLWGASLYTTFGMASHRVEPLCCHHPPTAHRAGFYLDLGDGGFGSPVEAPLSLTLEGDDEACDEDESGNRYEDEHGLDIHRLF
jgi:hypothetical protein